MIRQFEKRSGDVSNHGIRAMPASVKHRGSGYYEMVLLDSIPASRYRLPHWGSSRLKKLDGIWARRREIASRYTGVVCGNSGVIPPTRES